MFSATPKIFILLLIDCIMNSHNRLLCPFTFTVNIKWINQEIFKIKNWQRAYYWFLKNNLWSINCIQIFENLFPKSIWKISNTNMSRNLIIAQRFMFTYTHYTRTDRQKNVHEENCSRISSLSLTCTIIYIRYLQKTTNINILQILHRFGSIHKTRILYQSWIISILRYSILS